MSIIQIGCLTLEGRRELARHVRRDETGTAPIERGEALAIFEDVRLYQPIPGCGSVDTTKQFKSNLEFLRYVWPALEPIIEERGAAAVVEDAGINAFLAAAFIEQITARARRNGGIRVPEAYLLQLGEVVAGGITRNYRNTLFVNMSFYARYKDHPALCAEFLDLELGVLSNPLERMCQYPIFMSSLGAWQLVTLMFMNPRRRGSFARPPRAGESDRTKTAAKSLRDIAILLFGQCARNIDVEEMDAAGLLSLVPDVPEYAYWRERAEAALAAAQNPARKRRGSPLRLAA